MQFFNRGLKAHLLAATHLIDDDHLVFTNFCGVGPIDLVRVNKLTGKTDFFDVKTDNDNFHRPRERSELQIKLGVQNLYVNLHKRTIRLAGKVEELQT